MAAEFALVDGEVLVPGGRGVHRFEIGKPGAAAEFAAATADTTYFSGFLAGADLAHFHLHLKFAGEYFDQFAEIDAVISDVEEGRFSPVGLYFYLAHLHVEVQLLGNGAALDKGFFFAGLILLPNLEVFVAGAAQYLFEVGVELVHIPFFHLDADDFAGQ